MVLSVPVTPDPAVTGPVTGGQRVAHDPVHLEAVEVSGANQYSVLPAELVAAGVPVVVVMSTALPPAAALLPPAAGAVVAGVPEDELVELAHADRARARVARPAAPNIFRIRILLFTVLMVSHGDHVPAGRSVHVQFKYLARPVLVAARGGGGDGPGRPPGAGVLEAVPEPGLVSGHAGSPAG